MSTRRSTQWPPAGGYRHTCTCQLLLCLPPGVIEEAEGLGSSARLSHPMRCSVSGGYTISKLQGYKGSASPESLLTCILQVGVGACSITIYGLVGVLVFPAAELAG